MHYVNESTSFKNLYQLEFSLSLNNIQGTGSINEVGNFRTTKATGSSKVIIGALENVYDKKYVVQYTSLPQKIAFIRWYLALNLKEVAEVLDVKRPTIYSWIAQESVPHDENEKRIIEIYNLLKKMEMAFPFPLSVGAKKLATSEGKNIVSILQIRPLIEKDVTLFLEQANEFIKNEQNNLLNLEKKTKDLGYTPMPEEFSENLDID